MLGFNINARWKSHDTIDKRTRLRALLICSIAASVSVRTYCLPALHFFLRCECLARYVGPSLEVVCANTLDSITERRAMWLLSTDRAELHFFPSPEAVTGGYAILSHAWGSHEQSFQETTRASRAVQENRRKSSRSRDHKSARMLQTCGESRLSVGVERHMLHR